MNFSSWLILAAVLSVLLYLVAVHRILLKEIRHRRKKALLKSFKNLEKGTNRRPDSDALEKEAADWSMVGCMSNHRRVALRAAGILPSAAQNREVKALSVDDLAVMGELSKNNLTAV